MGDIDSVEDCIAGRVDDRNGIATCVMSYIERCPIRTYGETKRKTSGVDSMDYCIADRVDD